MPTIQNSLGLDSIEFPNLRILDAMIRQNLDTDKQDLHCMTLASTFV
jgi:hypothetical protein